MTMAAVGGASVLAALVLAMGTAAAYVWGLVRYQEGLLRLARYGTVAMFAAVVAASVALLALLVALDFSVQYVVAHTSTDLEPGYALAAFWAGQEGSLLLWSLLLAGFTVLVAAPWSRQPDQRLADTGVAILVAVNLFFLVLLAWVRPPFALTPIKVTEGWGLNPQLQSLGMVLHPPSLYLGYVGFTVPFALALAGLILNQTDAGLFRRLRAWMLFSWLFLGLGIVLGAQWAYVELGWGGYWAWDPVENASLIPWLTATACLHASVVMHRRGGLRRWGLILLCATFILTIVGTFLTRSGVIASVHAYAEGGLLGPLFVTLIGVSVSVSAGLLAWRWPHLAAPFTGTGGGRQASLLTATVLFAALAVAVLVGTLYPLFSQPGGEQSLSSTYYEIVSTPLGLLIMGLLGVCPALLWRGPAFSALVRYLALPAGAAGTAALMSFLIGAREPVALLAVAVCAWAGTAALEAAILDWRRVRSVYAGQEVWPLLRALTRQRRRYGSYLAHLGVALLVTGVVVSTAYASERMIEMRPGEAATVGQYTLHLAALDVEVLEHGRTIVRAPMTVRRDGRAATLVPQVVFYPPTDMPSSDPAIWGGAGQLFLEDLYVLLVDLDTFQVHINPLVDWIWVGGSLMLVGGLVALSGLRAARRTAL